MVALLIASLTLAHPIAQMPTPVKEDKDGWIVLHVKGSPHDIGFQYGAALARECDDDVKTVAALEAQATGKDWAWFRNTAKQLFWPKLDKEYQDEISGIAEGMQSKGQEDDTWDILALNSYIELSDYYLPSIRAKELHAQIESHAPLACSAFVATGSETADGKVVMGHNFWWDYFTGERFHLVLDITPEKGNRVMFDCMPGFIESGTDWAVNDKGIAFCETTISNFVGFNPDGIPEFQRMRKAIQYSSSLADVTRIFKEGNNGGYANTWLMADTKTNEIGKLELGLKNVVYNSTKDGYYVGANFPEDPKLMREETPGYDNKGGNCEDRKGRWCQHLDDNKGKVDAEMARTFLADTYNKDSKLNDGQGGGALCAKGSVAGAINAKVLTSESVSKMQFWARMGVPDGSDLVAANGTKNGFGALLKPFLHDLKGQPWTVISAN